MKTEIYACDFCGKEQYKVKQIIVSRDVAICDECVKICVEVLEEQEVGE